MSILTIDLENLTEEDAAEYLRTIARTAGLPVQIWGRDDCELDADEYDTLTEEQRKQVADCAWENHFDGDITDCTDQDWDRIRDAQNRAIAELGF